MRLRAFSILLVATPFLFAAGIVLDRYQTVAAAPAEVVRPLLVALVATGVLVLLVGGILRNLAWTSLLASLTVALFLAQPLPTAVLLSLSVWWLLVVWLRRRRNSSSSARFGSPWTPARIGAIYGIVLFLISAAAFASGVLGVAPSAFHRLPPPGGSGGPDVFVLLLDGYPRADTLTRDFGLDNSAFEHGLEELGFRVAEDARSNYTKTWLTMASMLNASYLDSVVDGDRVAGGVGQQTRLAQSMIDDSSVLDYFRARGYEVVSIPSSVRTATVTSGVRVVDNGAINPLESALLAGSLVGRALPSPVVDFLAGDARALIFDQFAALEHLARPEAQPRLVITHIQNPHPPFVLGQDQEYLKACFPYCSIWSTTPEGTMTPRSEFESRLGIQLQHLNDLVIQAVRRIVENNPEAIVLVLSDHGIRHSLTDDAEQFRILFAARTGSVPNAFPEDISLVNVFRTLLSHYFGEELTPLPYRGWLSDWFDPLLLQPVP
jgi:hypothetical protein